ncbi:hypothetical protein ACH0D6_002208 [Enterococcus hirae]
MKSKMMMKELNILEKTSERQVKLALLLGMSSIECNTLTKQLNVTKKTLLSDIVFLTTPIPLLSLKLINIKS